MAVWNRQEENVLKLKRVIASSTNPMASKSEQLINIATKAVMPTQVQSDVCNRDEIGQENYVKFVEQHINSREVSIWTRMTKVQLKHGKVLARL